MYVCIFLTLLFQGTRLPFYPFPIIVKSPFSLNDETCIPFYNWSECHSLYVKI